MGFYPEDVGKVTFELDNSDPMDKVFINMIQTNHSKRADYADAGDFASNFRKVAQMMDLEGYTALEDCMTMICRKVARINNLRGRPPSNESVLDSWLDLAVYAALGYAIALETAEFATSLQKPMTKKADPELERLLAEEQEIEAQGYKRAGSNYGERSGHRPPPPNPSQRGF